MCVACARTPPAHVEERQAATASQAAATSNDDDWKVLFYGAPTSPPTDPVVMDASSPTSAQPLRSTPLLEAMTKADEPSSAQRFDSAEANRVMHAVRAKARHCVHDGGTFHARAVLTFDASGKVAAVRLDDDTLASTDVGRCVVSTLREAQLRGVHVPVTIALTIDR